MSAQLNQNLYNQDYYQWTVETANALKSKSYDAVDIEHLIVLVNVCLFQTTNQESGIYGSSLDLGFFEQWCQV